jgi:toxin ParE1/3/4
MGQTRRRAGGRRHGLILEWTEAALEARFAQLDFIALDKPTAAIDMDERIESQTSLLLDHPDLGRKGRVKGTRELVIAGTPFIAVYRVLGERIEIFRFLHGAQQWPKRLSRP